MPTRDTLEDVLLLINDKKDRDEFKAAYQWFEHVMSIALKDEDISLYFERKK